MRLTCARPKSSCLSAVTVAAISGILLLVDHSLTAETIAISDSFDTGSGSVHGRTPDITNLPGGTYASTDNPFGAPPNVTGGTALMTVNSAGLISMQSAGSYVKPAQFTISADVRVGTIAGNNLGVGLGFNNVKQPVASVAGFADLSVGYDPYDVSDPFAAWVTGDAGQAVRTALSQFAASIVVGTSYHAEFPIPNGFVTDAIQPVAPQTAPFVGLAGLAPRPTGKLKAYLIDWAVGANLSSPSQKSYFWGYTDTPLLLPLPLADTLFNLPLDLTYTSSLTLAAANQGRRVQYDRVIHSFVMLHRADVSVSWDEVGAAVVKPTECDSAFGDTCVRWDVKDVDPSQYGADFQGAGIFFTRGPFGILLDVRDYSGNAPEWSDLAELAKPIDKLLAGVVSGKPSSVAMLGIPLASEDAYQQVRLFNGSLIRNQNETDDDLAAARAILQPAIDKKASLVVSSDTLSNSALRSLLPMVSENGIPTYFRLNLNCELYYFSKTEDATEFAATFEGRITGANPGIELTPADSEPSQDGALVTAFKLPTTTLPLGGAIAQVVSGHRVGVVKISSYTSDLYQRPVPELQPEAIAASTAFVSGAVEFATQVAAGSNYRFRLP